LGGIVEILNFGQGIDVDNQQYEGGEALKTKKFFLWKRPFDTIRRKLKIKKTFHIFVMIFIQNETPILQ